MQVTFFQRKPHPQQFSLEKVFKGIRQHLPSAIIQKTHTSPYPSQGILPRIKNLLAARKDRDIINHITGDVHYLALALPRHNTILTIHDIIFVQHPSFLARKILTFFWLTWPVHRVHYVTVISQATKDHVLQYVKCDPGKIRVIPDFVSADFKPQPVDFNQDQPVILQVGTKHNKNLEKVIPAISGLPCHLSIIGRLSPTQKELLEKHKISYTNQFDLSEAELIRQYEQADMLVFCSLLEGFGLPILEAQAVGRPVVTSNISSMPEIGGNAACLVDPQDIQSIRQGIQKVIENPGYRQQLIEKGFQNIKKYTPESVAHQYFQLYQEVYQQKNKN